MMKGLFGLLLVIVAFIAWMGSVTKVIQWNQAQQRGDRRVEEPSSPPGEAPSLLGRRTIGGGERSGAALLEFAIDPLSITTDESVEAELSLHSEGRFEVRMPKRWDLEQSKEFVYRIQHQLRTLVTMPGGEILTTSGTFDKGWFFQDIMSSDSLPIFTARGADGVSRIVRTSARSECSLIHEDSENRTFSFDVAPFLDRRSLGSMKFEDAEDYLLSFAVLGFSTSGLKREVIGEFRFGEIPRLVKPHMKSEDLDPQI